MTLKSARTQSRYVITQEQLPLSCPMDGMPVWNAHPKIFLPIKKTGKSVCPYCLAEYVIEGFENDSQTHLID